MRLQRVYALPRQVWHDSRTTIDDAGGQLVWHDYEGLIRGVRDCWAGS
jgi:hypothetical protein